MTTLKAALAALTISLFAAACGENPCEQLKTDLIACASQMDCSQKPEGQERTTCEAAKTAAASGSLNGVTLSKDQCTGDIETAARACVLLGPDPANNCRCA